MAGTSAVPDMRLELVPLPPESNEGAERPAQPGEPFTDWAFSQSPFALAIHDKDLLCLRVNDRMCQMFGLAEDELRGRRLTDVLPGLQYDALERYMRQVLDTCEPDVHLVNRPQPGPRGHDPQVRDPFGPVDADTCPRSHSRRRGFPPWPAPGAFRAGRHAARRGTHRHGRSFTG